MKKLLIILIPLIVIIAVAYYVVSTRSESDSVDKDVETAQETDKPAPDIFNLSEDESAMNISSPAFTDNAAIPSKYTCDGEDINPELEISDVPEKAKSLVLIADDPDAPVGLWIHWLIWNIDPKTTSIEENSVPDGAQEGTTSFGKTGYGGPCPPDKEHRYFFKLYALDTTLSLDSNETKDELESAMEGHIIDQTELVGLYDRPR